MVGLGLSLFLAFASHVGRICAVLGAIPITDFGNSGPVYATVTVEVRIVNRMIVRHGKDIYWIINSVIGALVIQQVITRSVGSVVRTVASGEPPLKIGGSFLINFHLPPIMHIRGVSTNGGRFFVPWWLAVLLPVRFSMLHGTILVVIGTHVVELRAEVSAALANRIPTMDVVRLNAGSVLLPGGGQVDGGRGRWLQKILAVMATLCAAICSAALPGYGQSNVICNMWARRWLDVCRPCREKKRKIKLASVWVLGGRR